MAEKKKKTNRPTSAKEDIINRVYVLYAAFIVVGLLIAGRIIQVQVADKNVDKHIAVMEKNITNIETKLAHRGAILDRNGKPLAMSNLSYEPVFDFASDGMTRKYKDEDKVVKELRALANQMAVYFSMADAKKHGYTYKSADEYFKLFTTQLNASKGNRSVRIFPRPVVLDDWNMMTKEFPVINHSLGGVYKHVENDIRVRPYDNIGLQIIGVCYGRPDITADTTYVIKDGKPERKIHPRDTTIRHTSGLERIYDSVLAGVNGRVVEQRIASGFWVQNDEDNRNLKPIDGDNIVTTIDADLQLMATETLRSELEKHCGSFGVAMVMEAKTGNILCMVNLTSGRVRGTNYSEGYYNHAMRTRMSPGSTFKMMSTMALLELGQATINTRVDVPSSAVDTVGRKRVSDTHVLRDEDGNVIKRPTLLEGFAHSSNIYFARAIYERFKNDPAVLTSYYESLMLNSHIGLEPFKALKSRLPLAGSKSWKGQGGTSMALPGLAYGYIIELTPIHTLTFYNGVANGGKMVAPRFVDRIERNGRVIEEMPVEVLVERMCSEQSVKTIYECMTAAAVPSRTANTLKGLPIKVGCKTGTAQISGKFSTPCVRDSISFVEGLGTTEGKHPYYLGSMVAIAPIDNPKYTIMVVMAKEKTDSHPKFYGASIAGDAVREIINFLYTNDLKLHPSVDTPERSYTPLFIKGGRGEEVGKVSEAFCNISNDESFDSEWCSVSVSEGGSTSISSLSISSGYVPDVRGMGLTDAIFLLEQQGLIVTHSGVGRVTSQSIAPGTKINKSNTNITLKLGI